MLINVWFPSGILESNGTEFVHKFEYLKINIILFTVVSRDDINGII